MTAPYRDMVPYFHNHGGDACGGIAFYVNRVSVAPHAPVHAQDVEFEDGSNPDPGSGSVCEQCKTQVWLTVQDVGGKARLARKIEDDNHKKF